MLRITASCFLVALLLLEAVPAAPAADLTVAEQATKLKVGRKIKVELASGETVKGRMGSSTAGQLTLEPRSSQGTARVVRFTEARSVKADGLTKGQKWIIFGVIWVAVGVAARLTT